jgi:catechol 2,3-dioxygenase-like lactoylglutathione lyase family enzyme
MMSGIDLEAIAAARQRLRDKYLHEAAERPQSTANGIHHMAVLSSDAERTIQFYQGILEFPLTNIFENRDYWGSNHFFFDIGNGNALAFFDFPGLDLGDYREVLGGLHHVALSMEPAQWERIKAKLDAEGIDYQHIGRSIYFRDPDGTRLELIPEPLGKMNNARMI